MMRIDAAQLGYFTGLGRHRFVALMTDYFRSSFAVETASMDAESLCMWVDRALALCERAGVDTEPEAAQLMAILLVIGLDAEFRYPWVTPIVARRGLHPAGKVRLFFSAARAEGLPVDDVVLYPEYERPGDVVLDIADPNVSKDAGDSV